MVSETVRSVQRDDPAHGDWCAEGQELNVWVDASSLAIGVALERYEAVLKDACWLGPENDAQHINLAELDAVLKGINLALQWQCRVLRIKTDPACVYHWLSDTLTGRARVRTKTASEMLIRRRLNTLKDLVAEYHLTVDVTLVPSNLNLADHLADRLTCVPQRWFDAMKRGNGPEPLIGATQVNELNADQIPTIHRNSGHSGVWRTIYFVRKVCSPTTKAAVRSAIRSCEECQSIDSAPIHWQKGKLEVSENWQRLGMDITHYGVRHFLTLTDCGQSRFSIWKQLARQDSATVILQLEAVFFERGPPHELLTDNDPAFWCSEFRAFAREWKINLRFRCAYAPAGNGVAERCHRTVKRTAGRMSCSIHITPKDGESRQTATANRIHRYKVRVKGFNTPMTSSDTKHSFYQIGDRVWVKAPHSRCTTKFNRGRVTGMISLQSLLVDGIPRHVKDLRPRFSFTTPEKDSDSSSESDNASESGAESLLFDGESEESDSPPQEEAEAESPSLTKKCLSKTTATKLPPLWSRDQEGV